MEELKRAICDLSVEFDKLLNGVKDNVNNTSETAREESQRRLEKAQDPPSGILARAGLAKEELESTIARYRQFQSQLSQLEQIHLISEDLKDVVRSLERRHKHQG